MEEKYQLAEQLLIPIWRGVDSAYKSRYARTIWQQFEDNIRSAAYTSSLSRFYNALCLKLAVTISTRDLTDINTVLQSGRDRELLRLFRDEPGTCVLLVRVVNEQRKEQWKQRQEEYGREAVEQLPVTEESIETLFNSTEEAE